MSRSLLGTGIICSWATGAPVVLALQAVFLTFLSFSTPACAQAEENADSTVVILRRYMKTVRLNAGQNRTQRMATSANCYRNRFGGTFPCE
jgi:hypothetical protein